MYFRSRICMAQNSCCEQMIERDVINAESCYQENGEEVRREEACEEVRPQGRRQEGHAQRGGKESLCEEGLREARASKAQESDANADLRIVRHVARRLVGLRVPTYRLIRRGCRRFGLA